MDKRRRIWPAIAGVLLLLPVVYVASIGPAFRLLAGWHSMKADDPREAAIMTFYTPIFFASDKSDHFRSVIDWCINLWVCVALVFAGLVNLGPLVFGW